MTPAGLRTLAPGDPAYAGRYAGGPASRDAAYHQGTAWPWLLGFYVRAALHRWGSEPGIVPFLEGLVASAAGNELAVGLVPELADGDPPHAPGGVRRPGLERGRAPARARVGPAARGAMIPRAPPSSRWALVALALVAGCGASPAPGRPAPAAAPTGPPVDICRGSPPVPHPYSLILRNARCDQDMYITMASVADQLGVGCSYCHAPVAGDAKKQDYPAPTRDKEIAGWMSAHLMQAIKPADGSPMRCRSCHTDEAGKPVAKILGSPRDPEKANEWMSLVMVRRFVAADGSKLRCKSCHVGTPGTPGFHPAVILQTDQLPKHAAGGPGTPSF